MSAFEEVAGYRVRRQDVDEGVWIYEVEDQDQLIDDATRDERLCPYGGVAWGSGLAAARALVQRARPRVVVDVGCGVGPVALACARAGARVVALDRDPIARALTQAAARAQDLSVDVRAFDLDGELPALEDALWVFADMLYSPELAAQVARHAAALRAAKAAVVVVDPGRFSRSVFLEQLGAPANFERVPKSEGELAWCWL